MSLQLTINQKTYTVDVEPEMPLLWVLRDELGLVGTKFGCGMAQCGACTVHVNGQAIRSCVYPVGQINGAITTIEGLGQADALHAVQAAWIEQQVAQCGYCQPGMQMAAAALLAQNPNPDETAIKQALAGNLCRCGTYNRISKAVQTAATKLAQAAQNTAQEV